MPRLLLEFDERELQHGGTEALRHICAVASVVTKITRGWAVGRSGLRGALFVLPFGIQHHLLMETLPLLLDPPAWKAPLSFRLRPNHNPDALVHGVVLAGVPPHAFEIWKGLAPMAPSSWLDLAFPTDVDALRVSRELGGVVLLDYVAEP